MAKNRAWKWAFRLAIGVLIVGALLRGNPAEQIGPLLRRVSPLILILSVALYEIGQLLSAWRWRMIFNVVRTQNDRGALSMMAAARIYLAGMFWNLWVPSGIGGDAFRAYAAGRIGGLGAGAASILLDRLIGLGALIALCALGLLFDARGAAFTSSAVLWMVPVALAIATIVVFGPLRPTLRRWMKAQRNGRVRRWRVEWKIIARRLKRPSARKVPWIALGVSFLVQALQIVINFGLARAVGLDLPFATFVWIAPALALSSLVPLGIGGLGVREVAAVALLKGSGASVGTIVAWSLLWQATLWMSSLPGGLWAFSTDDDRRSAQ